MGSLFPHLRFLSLRLNINMGFNQFRKLLNLFTPTAGAWQRSGGLTEPSSSTESLGTPMVCTKILFKDNPDIRSLMQLAQLQIFTRDSLFLSKSLP